MRGDVAGQYRPSGVVYRKHQSGQQQAGPVGQWWHGTRVPYRVNWQIWNFKRVGVWGIRREGWLEPLAD